MRRELLVETGGLGAVRLPSVELSVESPRPTTIQVLDAIEAALGAPVIPLRIRPRSDVERESTSAVVFMEPMAGADVSRYRAAPADEIRGALDTLEPAEARDEVRWWLQRLDASDEPREAAWTHAGWFARASSWTIDRLNEIGLPPTEAPRIMYQDVLGTVIRSRSGTRSAYMKCAAPFFRSEASMLAALAHRVPDTVPEVLAIEPSHGWALMGDVGDRILGEQPESTWAAALSPIAAMQRAWVGHTEELVAAGAQVRPVGALADAVPGFLDRERLGERLAPEVRSSWMEALPRLVDACRQLDDIGLPSALIHGDLHPWNVALNDDGLRVFDWSDCAVGNSFVDLAVFIRRAKDVAVRGSLRDAYVEGWATVAPRRRLVRAVELAMTVGALYQVETYLALLPSMDPHDHGALRDADVRWVRRALDGLERGIDTTV